MIRQKFTLPKYGWHCSVYYAVDCYYIDDILSDMEDIGCSGDMLEQAYNNMASCKLNTGVTYSNGRSRETVMVVALTSSSKEFEKSWRHECGHLATHICKASGIPLDGEEIQYLGDDIVEEMWYYAKTLLCECNCCKNKVKRLIN